MVHSTTKAIAAASPAPIFAQLPAAPAVGRLGNSIFPPILQQPMTVLGASRTYFANSDCHPPSCPGLSSSVRDIIPSRPLSRPPMLQVHSLWHTEYYQFLSQADEVPYDHKGYDRMCQRLSPLVKQLASTICDRTLQRVLLQHPDGNVPVMYAGPAAVMYTYLTVHLPP